MAGLLEGLVSQSKKQKEGIVSYIAEKLGMQVIISFVVNLNLSQLLQASLMTLTLGFSMSTQESTASTRSKLSMSGPLQF